MVKDPIVTSQVYHMIYCNGQPPKKSEVVSQVMSVPVSQPSSQKPQVSSKRVELMSALQELKSKPVKSKQDKDSISVIEAVLKNEK